MYSRTLSRSTLSVGYRNAKAYATIPAGVAAEAAVCGMGSIELPKDVNDALQHLTSSAARQRRLKSHGMSLTDELKRMTRTKHRGGIQPNFHQALQSEDQAGAGKQHYRKMQRGKLRQRKHELLSELSGDIYAHGKWEDPEVDAEQATVQDGATLAASGDQREPASEIGMDSPSVRESDSAEPMDATVDRRSRSHPPPPATALRIDNDAAIPITTLEAAAHASSVVSSSAAEARRRYGDSAVLAYATARLPACYAAMRRVLAETASRLGADWRPTTMLDFGAGPGTATLAAQDTWPAEEGRGFLRVTAVDASESMAMLGRQLQAARKNENGSSVWWTPRLGASRHRTDLVTAGYVLCELSSDAERARLVAKLWDRVEPGGVLVIVEPGTPAGNHNILAARSQILSASKDRQATGLPHDDCRSAYVVAPCPHDGACPLQGGETWCHFSQRFQRSTTQRGISSTRSQLKKVTRGHADERFSYVVLRRASRPAITEQPSIDAEIPLPDDVLQMYRQVPPEEVPRRARKQLGLELGIGQQDPESSNQQRSTPINDVEDDLALLALAESRGLLDDLDEATRELIRESLGDEQDLFEEAFLSRGDDQRETSDLVPPLGEQRLETSIGEETDEHPAASSLDKTSNFAQTGEEDPARLAAEASQGWSRVVRPPLKKAGHVVLDLCSAVDESARRGELVRQVVARLGSERRLGGRGAYRLARELAWGDLWPANYQDRLPSSCDWRKERNDGHEDVTVMNDDPRLLNH